jgi:dihydrofolate synthase/folylpolyglutamate synthase
VIVLEVGLGGRLDAVNVVDPDVAIVVSVGLDHMEFLGPDVEAIGREKAGIFRTGRPAVFGTPQPPRSLRAYATELGASLQVRGEHFEALSTGEETWDFVVAGRVVHAALPPPALPGPIQRANAATVLAALDALATRLPLPRTAVVAGLQSVRLAGRFQRLADARGFEWVFDVAHNPAAAATLAASLRAAPARGRTLAVCGMLGDKDVPGVVGNLTSEVDRWFAASSAGPRAIDDVELARRARDTGVEMTPAGDLPAALSAAAAAACPGDRIVVLGSFHTVGPALAHLGVPL